jgi:hypothetical protein
MIFLLFLVLLLVGALIGGVLLGALLPILKDSPVLMRANYRGESVPLAGGIPIAATLLIGFCLLQILWSVTDRSYFGANAVQTVYMAVFVVLVVTLFGLLDDAVGTAAAKGLRGHLRALKSGRLTTGLLKLAAGAVAGLIAASQAEESVLWIVVGAVCIAAWANVGNLFDLGPGRCIKVCWPISATLTLVFLDSLVPLALALGSVLGVLGSDLKEKVMLGDTGANPLGALVGVCFLATGNHAVVVGGCLVGIALNLAAEKVSFSRIIVSNSLLLRLDSLGATEARRVYLRTPRQ